MTKRTELTAAGGLARAIIAAAEKAGVAVEDALRELNFGRNTLEDPEGRVPASALFEVTQRLADASKDPLFGLHVAERFVDASTFGVLGFALRTSSTLGEAIDRVVRYSRVMNESTRISVARSETAATIFDGAQPPLAWPRHYAEMSMANFFVLARKWTGANIIPHEVAFQNEAPASAAAVREFFGCPVSWRQSTNRIAFPIEALALPFPVADEQLATFLDRRLTQMSEALDVAPGSLARVRTEVERSLASGPPSLARIARAVALSARTLQRRLSEQGTCFEDLVDSVRREVALAAIQRPRVSIQEVSFLCGYADARAFRRAFRRWTGASPAAYAARPAHA